MNDKYFFIKSVFFERETDEGKREINRGRERKKEISEREREM